MEYGFKEIILYAKYQTQLESEQKESQQKENT